MTYAATQADGAPATSPNQSASAAGMMNDHGGSMPMGAMMTGMGRFTADQPFDAQFLDQMAVHHQGAIMSTKAMIAGSDRPELRALAENILTSQQEQLSQMRAWRAQWYPDLDPTFGMGGSMMGGAESMAGEMMGGSMMGGAGDESMAGEMMGASMMEIMMGASAGTERMYVQMMIVHHQLAVDMAEQAQRDATHPQLKDLAADIAGEQGAQIKQMRGYLAASPSPAGD